MAEPESIIDAEFDAQLRGLFAQAQKAIENRAAAASGKQQPAEKEKAPEPVAQEGTSAKVEEPAQAEAADPGRARGNQLSLIQLLKPLVMGLEAVSRATGENTGVLKKLETATDEASKAREELPAVVSDLRAMVDARNGVSQSMFAALHEELKGYKDAFLLDSVHRPIIRDLISLYDDAAEILRQVSTAIEAGAAATLCGGGVDLLERLRTIEVNIEHNLGFITEVLNRLEVTLLPPHVGKLDKQTQRAIAVELAEDPDEDCMVVRSMKRCFLWKERVFRAEEVIIKKYKEGFLVALAPPDQKNASTSPHRGT